MNEHKIQLERIELLTTSDDLIVGDLRYIADRKKKPVVIICHSFMAFKDWGFFPYIGEKLAEAEFVPLTFNFSYNGVSKNGERITDFDKFAQNTISKELEDIDEVVNAVDSGKIGAHIVDKEKIILLGHSRGGGIAIVHAAHDKRIKALVTLSSVATFDRWTAHQKQLWRTSGYLPLSRDTSVSPLRLGIELLNDVEIHKERLSITNASVKVRAPWLIVHGKADVTVHSTEAEQLYAASNKSTTELALLDKVGHLYPPWQTSTRVEGNYVTLNKILDLIIHWLNKNL